MLCQCFGGVCKTNSQQECRNRNRNLWAVVSSLTSHHTHQPLSLLQSFLPCWLPHCRFTSWAGLSCQNVPGQCRVQRIGVQSVVLTVLSRAYKLTKKCERIVRRTYESIKMWGKNCILCKYCPFNYYSEQVLMKTQPFYLYFWGETFLLFSPVSQQLKTILHWQPEARIHLCSTLII